MKLKWEKKAINLRYFVKVKHDDFIKMPLIKMRNVTNNDEFVTFTTNKKGLLQLNEEEIPYETKDRVKELMLSAFVKHLPITLTLILIFLLLLISSKYVREIKFEDSNDYNYEVYQTVNKHLVRKGLFYELDIDLNSLSRILRTTYQQYAYIGIRKEGAKLVIEVESQDIPNRPSKSDNTPGDIIARYDAYIEGVETRKGTVLVTTSQSVKKGQILISGNVNYKINPSDLTKLVRPDGLVIGWVAEYKTYTINKQNTIYDYSSNLNKYYELNLFGRIIKTKNKKEYDGYKRKTSIFTLFNTLKLDKVEEYEEVKLNVVYDVANALSYAKSLVHYDFNLEKVSEKEYVESITLIKKEEKEDGYCFVFLVKSLRNIGEFKKYN